MCVIMCEFMLHIVMTTSAIWMLGWTLHRSKCAGYHYITWSCVLAASLILLIIHTPNLQYVPTDTVSKGLHYIFMSNHTITFQPTLFAVMRCCSSCGPVRRSFSLESVQYGCCHTGGHCLRTEHRTYNQNVACIHSGSAHRCKNAFYLFHHQSSNVPV